jgi:hypothetical protein
MYEGADSNYREVEKALKQIERAIAGAIRRNDWAAVASLTRVQLLIASVKAEARLIKIAYTPKGMSATDRNTILAQDTALNRWTQLVDLAFQRHYKVSDPSDFKDGLDHDILAKYTTLNTLINDEVRPIILLRNKLAHGQWNYPFNSSLTGIEGLTLASLQNENTLTIRYRDRLISQLGNIIVDLVTSSAGFEARFNEYFVKIRRYRIKLMNDDFATWTASIKATKVTLSRVAPTPSEAI